MKNASLVVMNCIDAIALNDGRELFVLKFDLKITNYLDKFCISTDNKTL